MKELSIEEKAKAYDNALKVLHKYDGANIMFSQDLKEEMFPELKESGDEKIRKELIDIVKKSPITFAFEDKSKVLAWLEKQGDKSQYWKPSEEQLEALDYAYNSCSDTERGNYYEGVLGTIIEDLHKLSEKQGKQKPDKVEPKFKVRDWLVTDKNNVVQIKAIENGKYVLENTMKFSVDYVDKCWKKWDIIKDAKDGDVLVDEDNNIGIYEEIEGICWHSYIYLGYDKHLYGFSIGGSHIQNNTKPATKEQRDTLMKAIADTRYTFDFEKKELKKIEQKPTEWNEEDIMRIDNIIAIIENRGYPDYVSWLKSLKDRIQSKPEWSEEDESMLNDIMHNIHFAETHRNVTGSSDMEKDQINWLKSLLPKVKPQNRWKPSDEQMITLRHVISGCSYDIEPLVELETKLKEL